MFTHPYALTVTKNYNVSKVKEELHKEKIKGSLVYHSSGRKIREGNTPIYLLLDKRSKVPPFHHPVVVDYEEHDYIVFDVRTMAKPDENKIIDVTEPFTFKVLNYCTSIMGTYLNDSNWNDLYSLTGNLSMFVFITLFKDSITRRLGLDPLTSIKVATVAGLYYWCIHNKTTDLEEKDIVKISTKISKTMGYPIVQVIDLLSELRYMHNLESFMYVIKSVGENSRLDELNLSLLLGILSSNNGLRVNNAKEAMLVALEYPPMWHALVWSVIGDRGFGRSNIANILKDYRKKDEIRSYELSMKTLVGL